MIHNDPTAIYFALFLVIVALVGTVVSLALKLERMKTLTNYYRSVLGRPNVTPEEEDEILNSLF